MMYRQTKRNLRVLLALVALIVASQYQLVRAYNTGPLWPNVMNTTYEIDPNLSFLLGVNDPGSAIRAAAATWDNATIFRFTEIWYGGNANIITARNFNTGSVPCPVENNFIAVSCVFANPSFVSKAQIFFNTSFQFNTSNINSSPSYDVQSVATHEFGHWFRLEHSTTPPAVMGQYTVARVIEEDDKQGVTQLYGAYTGFDLNRASGISNYSTYSARVSGYNGSGSSLLGVTASGDSGVPAYYGTQMLRLSGSATSGLSYIYFKLFSIDKDTGGSHYGVTIPSGAHLKWCQYNYIQSTMSVDLGFTDGTSLRDYNVVDQNGVRTHPKYRSAYGTGGWYCFDVDLSPVVGKQVRHWYIAYDNSVTSYGGNFRSYFDSLKLVWPGGKP